MRVLACVSAAVLCSGCFVFEELDAGTDILDSHTPTAAKSEPEPAAAPQASASSSDSGWRDQLKEWWRTAGEEEPVPAAADDVLVRCEVRGTTLFVRTSDCRLRGGRPIALKKQQRPPSKS